MTKKNKFNDIFEFDIYICTKQRRQCVGNILYKNG